MVEKIRPIIASSRKALDIGTGTGDLVKAVAIKGKYIGMDISDDMLKIAREKNAPDKEFICGSAYRLPFEDHSFDAATYKYALHHLDKPLKSLMESYRVLNNGGHIVIADVSSFENPDLHRIFNELNTTREPANYEYRSIATIKKLLSKTGFKNIKVLTKKFGLVLEEWLDCFYSPEITIPFVLNSPDSFKKAILLKEMQNKKHKITLASFVLSAEK